MLSQAVVLPSQQSLHETRYYQKLVEAITQVPSKNDLPKLLETNVSLGPLQQRFPEIFATSNTLFIGLNPGSIYGSAKRWKSERFAEVGDQLVAETSKYYPKFSSVRCVLIGGKGEEALGEEIAKRMRTQPIVLSGQTTIQELMEVLRRCVLLVTNDTGPMHVAQALGVPVAALFGPTDPESTGPAGEEFCVIREPVRCSPCLLRSCPIDHRCMTNISSEQVSRTIMKKMDRYLECFHDREYVGT